MTILGLPIDTNVNDTPRAKLTRAALGATYGLLGGTAFVFVAAFIDIWLYPDLPLGVDWSLLVVRWFVIALGLALIGALTSWWNETWSGLGSGAVITGLIVLASALYLSDTGIGMKLIVLIFALIPIAVLCLPIAWILRWLVVKHRQATGHKLSVAVRAGLILITIVLGAGLGYFMKMSPRALSATRYVHNLLQTTADEKNPVHAVHDVPERADMSYKLYQQQSVFSTEGFDIRVEYQDEYKIKCTIVVYPGRDPYLASCRSVP
jgi:hypothetical protein